MIKKALQKQMNGEGFCLVEVLSPCPTNWNKQLPMRSKFMKSSRKPSIRWASLLIREEKHK